MPPAKMIDNPGDRDGSQREGTRKDDLTGGSWMTGSPTNVKPQGSTHFAWGGVTFQLFAILILPLTALLLAITFWSINLHQGAMRSLVGERDERAVQTMAAALEAQISQRAAAIQNLARQAAAVEEEPLDGVVAGSDYLLDLFEGGLAIFSRQGDLLAWNGDRGLWEAAGSGSWAGPGQFLSQEPGEIRITPALAHPVSGEKLVFISAGGQTEVGREVIAAGAFSPLVLARKTLLPAFPAGRETGVILVDQNRELLYTGGELSAAENPQEHAGVAEALLGKTGATYVPAGGSEHVVAYTPVRPAGWALVIEEPWEMVASPLLSYTQMAPLVLVPVLLLMLLALWFGVRQIVQPLQALESQAVSLAWGDYAAVEKPVGGIAEIQRLQQGLIYLAQKVRAAQQSLRGYIGAITAGQEEERRRLARELHDDTIQSLIALKQRVQWVQMNAPDRAQNGTLPGSLAELEELTEKIIDALRRVTRALRPIYLEDLGLPAALKMLAREVGKTSDLAIDYRARGDERRLPPRVELALYRMAQEALSNAVRHAQASRAGLAIDFTPQAVKLEISDNGQGFEPPKSPAEYVPAGHFGLLGLYERAVLIGAHLEIHSAPAQGTQIRITLPDSA